MISDSDDVEICTVDDILNELYPEISSDSSDEETETVAQYSNPDIPIVTVPQGSNTPPYVPPSYSFDEEGGSVAQDFDPDPPTVTYEPKRSDSPDYNPPKHPPKPIVLERSYFYDDPDPRLFHPPPPPPHVPQGHLAA